MSPSLRVAVDILQAGGVVAYPTEAVWGLGCDPDDPLACRRLLQIKQRPAAKGMILVAAAMEQLDRLLAPLPATWRQTLSQHWPGPVTFLIPDPQQCIPWWIKGEHDKVAVRVSAHPTVAALCRGFDGPLVSTSANRAGRPPVRSRIRLMRQFRGDIDFVVPGRLGAQAQPSRIIDLASGDVLR